MMQRRRNRFHRRGAALLVAIVAVTMVAALGLVMVRSTLVAKANQETAAARLQADWLAEAGIERAAARYAANPEYSGETWTIAPESLGGRGATVEIEVVKKEDKQILRATATFPSEGTKLARRVKEIRL